jgi:phosphatidylserine decarboxylase
MMTPRELLGKITDHEGFNFLVTNRIPRRTLTRLAGWIATREHPLLRIPAIAIWRMFSDLDLSEAKKTSFTSLRDCFIRELRDGARPIDSRPDIVTSPCDGIVGAFGRIEEGVLTQIKGSVYPLRELVRDDDLTTTYRDGVFVTLRLTASMYHRFHAPHDCRVERISHIWGDVWNVNPPALHRVPWLFCRNERAVLRLRLAAAGHSLTLVPVAAVLVAGLRLRFADLPSDRAHAEPWSKTCDAALAKGQEMGWFEHGSTIIVLAPAGFAPVETLTQGATIRMGKPLLRLPETGSDE